MSPVLPRDAREVPRSVRSQQASSSRVGSPPLHRRLHLRPLHQSRHRAHAREAPRAEDDEHHPLRRSVRQDQPQVEDADANLAAHHQRSVQPRRGQAVREATHSGPVDHARQHLAVRRQLRRASRAERVRLPRRARAQDRVPDGALGHLQVAHRPDAADQLRDGDQGQHQGEEGAVRIHRQERQPDVREHAKHMRTTRRDRYVCL